MSITEQLTMENSNQIQQASEKKTSISIQFMLFYISLFFIDGVISILDDFLQLGSVNFLMGIRNNVSLTIILLSLPYTYYILKIKKELRFRYYLLPICIFISCSLSMIATLALIKMGTPGDLLSLVAERNLIALKFPIIYASFMLISLMKLLVVLVNYKYFKIILKKSNRAINKNQIKIKNTMKDFFVTGILGGGTLPIYVTFQGIILLAMICWGPKGFIDVNSKSLLGVEKIYQGSDGKIVRLIPMMHIGKENFYKDISKIDASVKTLILEEGVNDDLNELKGLDYSELASSLGLSKQREHFSPKAKKEDNKNNIVFIGEQIKTSDMSQQTISLLKKIFKSFKKNNEEDTFSKLTKSNIEISTAEYVGLRNDLLDLRTNDLLSQFDEYSNEFQKVIIPWGALHMPDIEMALIKRGYVFQSAVKRELISWDEMIENDNKKFKDLSRVPASK